MNYSVNKFRNRIAHHEPICFQSGEAIIDSKYVTNNYNVIQNLFSWLNIDGAKLLFGLDHIQKLVIKMDSM